jgi:predicted Zn-dependent protease
VNTKKIIVAAAAMMIMTGCGSNRQVAQQGSKRYERKPILETSDERLASEAMMIDAKMRIEMGSYDEAMLILRKLVAREPGCNAAKYEISRLMQKQGMNDSAIVMARQAADGDQKNVWYQRHLASLYQSTHRTAELVKLWERIVANNPDVIDYYYEWSNACLMNNDGKGAIAVLNRIEKKVGITQPVSLQKAKIWTYLKREDKALEEMESLVKAMPHDSDLNGALADSYMSAGQYDKAKECYDRLLETDPDNEYVHISLAEYYKAIKQPRKAYEELKKGMAQKNLSTSNKLQILTNFYNSEEFYGIYSAYTFDLLETVMQEADDSTSYAAFYGDVLMRKREYGKAAQQFRLALTKDSSNYEVWEALLISELSSEADTAMLASHARRASKLFPLHPLPYYMQAIVEHDNHNYERAIELASRCEKMGFDKGYLEVETYSLLAACYNAMDDSRCLEYYQRILAMRPNDIPTLNSYAYRLAIEEKELEKAEQMSRRTLQAEPDNPYYLDTYGWILHKMGRDEEAMKYIERSMQRDEESEEVKEHWEEVRRKLKIEN